MKNAFLGVLLVVCLCTVGYQILSLSEESTHFIQQTAELESFKHRLTSINEWLSYLFKGYSHSKNYAEANWYLAEAENLKTLANFYTVIFILLSIICLGIAKHYKSKFLLGVTLLIVWVCAVTTPLMNILVVSVDLKVELSELLSSQVFKGRTNFLVISKSLFDAITTLYNKGHFLLMVLLIVPSSVLPLVKIGSLLLDIPTPQFLSKVVLIDVFSVAILIAFITVSSTLNVQAELLSGFYLLLSFSFFLIFFSLNKSNN